MCAKSFRNISYTGIDMERKADANATMGMS